MSCIQGPAYRVLKGRHREACGAPKTCPGCEPCPEPHCQLCRREHAGATCPACIAATRADLRRVVELAGHLEDQALNGRGALAPHGGIPGGDALVLQAPAATESGTAAQLLHRRTFGLDTSHTTDERRKDLNPPLAVLAHWEHRVRAYLGQRTEGAPDMERARSYLDEHLHEAARDLMFLPMARALSGTVRQLEDVLLDGIRPERSRVPCWECGARLVKVYADQLAADHYVCPRCGERYDQHRYERAKHDHLASEGADRYVHVPAAAAAVGRSERTLRTWIRQGVVSTSRDATGRLTAWWPDVRAAHAARKTRKRSEP